MRRFFGDLHVHIGRDWLGDAVKVSASRGLTFRGIIEECTLRKGIDICGVVDCHSPGVREELRSAVESGECRELPRGGIRTGEGSSRGVTILPACEVEVLVNGSRGHILVYLPNLESLEGFSRWLEPRVTNIRLSSQRCAASAGEVVEAASHFGGVCVPAHVFTPHRGILGCCADRMSEAFGAGALARIPAVELGLSADSDMADTIDELSELTFLSNSDAHSRETIARECNLIEALEPDFEEVRKALWRRDGRRVAANYGLDPRLGKYHRTFCLGCSRAVAGGEAPGQCPHCGSPRVVRGVWDRVRQISTRDVPRHPAHRPPYVKQVPLGFIPGIGRRTLDRLIRSFGSEMKVMHDTTPEELEAVAGARLAKAIVAAREGRLSVRPGSGGIYGSVSVD